MPESYPKPPIVEAVVELRFAGGAPWKETEQKLFDAFRSEFPGERREMNSFEIQTTLNARDFVTSGRRDFLKWLLPDSSGRHLVAFGPGVLSRHVLAPYPGWAEFRPSVDRAFATYCDVVAPIAVTSVGVRYIDQIFLPSDGRLDDFFRAIPPRLPSQPDGVTAFQVTTESQDAASRTTALLTLASGPQISESQRVVIYDLNVTRQLAEVGLQQWQENVEDLHARQRSIFEESITDRTRGLFR